MKPLRYPVLIAVLVTSGWAQAPAAFEVASVRPNLSGLTSSSSNGDNGYWIATNVTASSLIPLAFGRDYFQIEGVPGWAESARSAVKATTLARVGCRSGIASASILSASC